MNINAISTSKTSLFALLLSLIIMILTVVFLGKAIALMFACIISIMGGLATFLNSKEPILKTAGMAFFAIGSFWLLISPSWLGLVVGD